MIRAMIQNETTRYLRNTAYALMLIAACGCTPMTPDDGGSDNGPDTTTAPEWREAFPTSGEGFLSGVWGSGPDDVFVVGGQPEQSVIFHYDGTTWETMNTPDTPILIWAFGFGPDDVYAVGEQGTALGRLGLMVESDRQCQFLREVPTVRSASVPTAFSG